jgi:hypothetical protein
VYGLADLGLLEESTDQLRTVAWSEESEAVNVSV